MNAIEWMSISESFATQRISDCQFDAVHTDTVTCTQPPLSRMTCPLQSICAIRTNRALVTFDALTLQAHAAVLQVRINIHTPGNSRVVRFAPVDRHLAETVIVYNGYDHFTSDGGGASTDSEAASPPLICNNLYKGSCISSCFIYVCLMFWI